MAKIFKEQCFLCPVHIAKAKITTFQAVAMFRTAEWRKSIQIGLQIHKFHISRRICRVAMEVFGCSITHGREFGTSRISSTHPQEHQQPSKRISKPSGSRGKVRVLPDRRGVSINMAFSFARFFRSNGHLTLHGHQPSNQFLEKLHVQCQAQNWKWDLLYLSKAPRQDDEIIVHCQLAALSELLLSFCQKSVDFNSHPHSSTSS